MIAGTAVGASLDHALGHVGERVWVFVEQARLVCLRDALAKSLRRAAVRGLGVQRLVYEVAQKSELVLVVQIERASVYLRLLADVGDGHLCEPLLLKKGEERLRDACDCAIPNEDIPRCPRCGAPMSPWVRSPEFLEGSMYREQYRKYNGFLRSHLDDNVLFLELGVGAMTPMFIKEPFWNYVYQWPGGAHYVPITLDHAIVPDEIRDKSLAFDAEIDKVLHRAAEIKRGQAFTTQSDVFKAEKQIDCSDAVDVGW